MWPKAFSQLVELAPHITRLLPLADRFLKEKASGDQATRQALEEFGSQHRALLDTQRSTLTDLSERVHSEIGTIASQLSTETAALQRQVNELDKHLITTRADALAAKQATETMEARLTRIEAGQRRVQTLAIVAVALLVAILVLIASIFLRVH